MASKWDDLDASTEIEQSVTEDLKKAFEPRGATVTHHGTATRHAPGGRPDIVVSASDGSLDLVVEVTKSTGAAAEREFVSTTDHLENWAQANDAEDTHMVFAAPKIGARLRKMFLEFNRNQRMNGHATRVFVIDFGGLQTLLETMAARDPALFPIARWLSIFADEAWEAAADDASARQVAIDIILEEEEDLRAEVSRETQEQIAQIEQDLKKRILKLEDGLRDRGITGDNANKTLIYLTFLRLFEEKRVRERTGASYNRMTAGGFKKWADSLDAVVRNDHQGRLVNYLLQVVRSERQDLSQAQLLLAADGAPVHLHPNVTDQLIQQLVFPVLDQYEFIGSRLDVLGVVFETLARRGEKDTRVGQFFTPEEVVKFAVRIAQPHPADTVLDPAVGTGRFLIWAMQSMIGNRDLVGGDPIEVEKKIKSEQLLGTDIDSWVSTIAKMNMFIHGDGKTNIATSNGLILADRGVLTRFPTGIAEQVDLVLTNPPLGDVDFTSAADDWAREAANPSQVDKGEYLAGLGVVPVHVREETERLKLNGELQEMRAQITGLEAKLDDNSITADERKVLRSLRRKVANRADKVADLTDSISRGNTTIEANGSKLKGGALFMGALTQYLKPVSQARVADLYEWRGGRALIVLDEAILNTPAHGATRQFLRENYFIKGVVSLGRPAFKYLAHTDAKTSILYAIRKPSTQVQQQEPVFYAHAEKVGFDARGSWIGSDLPAVAEAFEAFEAVVRASYVGASYKQDQADAALANIEGFDRRWYAQPIGFDHERLDFFNARRAVLETSLREHDTPICKLGSLIEVDAVSRPEATRTGVYKFAAIERNMASIRSKGVSQTQYGLNDLWVLEEGQVVISGIDAVHGAIAVVNDDVVGQVMSKEMYAYRVRDGVDVIPEVIVMLLRSPQARAMLEGMVTGTSNRTRMSDAEQILDLLIPDPRSMALAEETVDALADAHESRARSMEALQQAEHLAEQAWGDAQVEDIDDEESAGDDHLGEPGAVPPASA